MCALEAVNNYCRNWAIQVNVNKIKTLVFSRGKTRKYNTFQCGTDNIELLSNNKYMGTVFIYNVRFQKAMTKQITNNINQG